jgi:putative DNA primase/helicase
MDFDDDDDFGALAPLDDAPPPPPEDGDPFADRYAQGAMLPLNDDGNGRRFALYFGADLMFVPDVGWFVWNGQVWAKDATEIEVRRKSQSVAPLVEREVCHLHLTETQMVQIARKRALLEERAQLVLSGGADEDKGALDGIDSQLREIAKLEKSLHALRASHRRFATQTGNSPRMKAMRDEAGVRLARRLDDLDAGALDINTESGLLRFTVARDGAFRDVAMVELPHDRAHLSTKIMPVRWLGPDSEAECPRFDAFFERIQPDPVMRSFLLRWFALGLTGLIEQKLCFFYGMGANGKSVLVDLMARIAGDYAATAKIESLTGTNRRGGGDATPDLVPLIGARMVRAAEPDEGMRWQEGLIKDLTGGEPILVRALHTNFVEVRPIFSLTISGNHKPDIRGTDDGIWRRLLLVPFDQSIPEREQIRKDELDAMLFAERDAIFTHRIVPALLDYLALGLREPDQVVQATAEFREESDPMGTFLDKCCLITAEPSDTITARNLVNAFQWWQHSNGGQAWTDRTVQNRLAEKAGRWRSRDGRVFSKGKSSVAVYGGIRFNDLFKRAWENVAKDVNGKPVGSAVLVMEDEA